MFIFKIEENEVKVLQSSIITVDILYDEKEQIMCEWEDVLEEGKLYSWEDEEAMEMVKKDEFGDIECIVVFNGENYGLLSLD